MNRLGASVRVQQRMPTARAVFKHPLFEVDGGDVVESHDASRPARPRRTRSEATPMTPSDAPNQHGSPGPPRWASRPAAPASPLRKSREWAGTHHERLMRPASPSFTSCSALRRPRRRVPAIQPDSHPPHSQLTGESDGRHSEDHQDDGSDNAGNRPDHAVGSLAGELLRCNPPLGLWTARMSRAPRCDPRVNACSSLASRREPSEFDPGPAKRGNAGSRRGQGLQADGLGCSASVRCLLARWWLRPAEWTPGRRRAPLPRCPAP
jgi:hypothetical protein